MTERRLSIGDFARRSRLSPKALRLYERLGLLTPSHVDPATGYRWYVEQQLAPARLIALLRRLDMPLAQVAAVVTATGPSGPRASELVAGFWAATERRVASQRELAAYLQERLGGEGIGRMYEIREREVPEQLVLTEQRHVLVAELPTWIGAAMARLLSAAERYGGLAGAPFVVYHGEVSEDSDGPVEVCVPVPLGAADAAGDGAGDGAGGPVMRREPAHREAYARLSKAQVEYPQILAAYDAVGRWVGERGSGHGAPREVYFTDFAAAAPGDEVCDVAFPLLPVPAPASS